MRKKGFSGSLITVHVRNNKLTTISRQRRIPLPTNNASEIAEIAFSLFKENYDLTVPIRSIGISVSKLLPETGDLQLSFLDMAQTRIKQYQLDTATDQLRNLFGFDCIERARCLRQTLKNYTFSNDPAAPDTLCTLPGCHI